MYARITAVIAKEFGHILADRQALTVIMLLPAIELLLLGYAINTVVDHLPTVIFDGSQDADSRSLVAAMHTSDFFDVRRYATSYEEAVAAVDAGEAKVAISIPHDFGSQVLRGQPAMAQLLVDGTDPNSAQAALFAADSIARVHSASVGAALADRLGRERPVAGVELRPAVLYNPSMLSAAFVVPGLIGIILEQQALGLTAAAIVRERELGTLEQINVTPVRPWELMLGKSIPYAVIALAIVAITLVVARLVFGIAIAGSVILLLTLSLLFLLGSLATGLLISAISQTERQARTISDLFLLPAILLTGFVFPREAMPPLVQHVSQLIPLTYFLQVLRGIILKGVGLDVLWPHVVPLAIYGALAFTASAFLFRKRAN